MYHPHTLRHMSYVYFQIFLTRQGNTSTIEAIFLHSGCGRVVQGAGHKAKRLVLQYINGVSSNPVEGRTKICQLKDVWFNFQTYILYSYVTCTYQVTFLICSHVNIFTFQYILLLTYTAHVEKVKDRYAYKVNKRQRKSKGQSRIETPQI